MSRDAITSGPLGQRRERPAAPVALLPNPDVAKAALTKNFKAGGRKQWRPKHADASTDSGKAKKLAKRIEATEKLLRGLQHELAELRKRAAADAAIESEPEAEQESEAQP
jgi:hypothetical protein